MPAHRINATELLREPGSSRHIELTVSPADVDVDDPRVSGEIGATFDVVSSIDGLTMHGTVSVGWHNECRRCLVPVDGVTRSQLDERFQLQPRDADTLPIVENQIDLAPLIREYVLLDLPEAPLCRPDCAGLCPSCGADRNEGECGCDTSVRDPRWSALDGLT